MRGNKGRVYPHAELSFPWRDHRALDCPGPTFGRPKGQDCVNALVAPGPLPVTLDPEKLALLARLANGLAPEQLYRVAAWSAARAGQARASTDQADAPAVPAQAPRLILYGIQTR